MRNSDRRTRRFILLRESDASVTLARARTRGETDATDEATRRAMARWRATAARELGRHRPVDGLCGICGAAWPCVVTCQQADFALAAL